MKTIIFHICIGMRGRKKKPHTDESVPVSKAAGEKGAVTIQTLNPEFGAWCGGDIDM